MMQEINIFRIYLVIKPAHHWDPIKFGIVFLNVIKIIIIILGANKTSKI